MMPPVKRLDWSPKKRAIAVTLRSEGYSLREIADKIGGGATPSGIRKLCKRFEGTSTVTTATGRGRKKCTSEKTDRRIVRLALKNRKSPANAINRVLLDSDVNISDRTVRRRLVSAGLRARIPRKRPYLNEKQRKKRITWAKEHILWTTDDWKKVLWSDETKISIFGSDGVRYVRRRPGEDNIPECTSATMKHPVSVMIWGCMAMTGVGRIPVVNGTINAVNYISSILQPKMLPSARDLFGS